MCTKTSQGASKGGKSGRDTALGGRKVTRLASTKAKPILAAGLANTQLSCYGRRTT